MKNLRFYLSAAGVAAIDRLTKLLWGNSRQPLIPGVLALNATRNSGMAFGWLPGGTLVLAVLSLGYRVEDPSRPNRKSVDEVARFF